MVIWEGKYLKLQEHLYRGELVAFIRYKDAKTQTILKRQAQSNNSEMITMPVQLKGGRGTTQYRVTDQNGNMVATLTNEDQARDLIRTNPNYKIQPIESLQSQ